MLTCFGFLCLFSWSVRARCATSSNRSPPIPPPTRPSRRAATCVRCGAASTRRQAVARGAGGFEVALDDRPIRTPARHPLVFPTRGLAEAAAAEWNAQGEYIEPRRCRSRGSPTPSSTASLRATDAGRRRGREVSRLRSPVLSRDRPGAPGRTAARAVGPGARLGARRARRALPHRHRRHAADAAGAGARRRARRDPARALAARRRPCGDDAHRLGAAGAGARPRRHDQRGGVDCGERRRGLEHRAVGRRCARARAPRGALRGDGGGGAGAGGGGWRGRRLRAIHPRAGVGSNRSPSANTKR